ncbi:methyltransferase [Roseibium alexandrii]
MSDWTETAPGAHAPQDERPSRRSMTSLNALRVRYRLWRNRLIGSATFRSKIARFPGTRWIAQKKSNDLFKLINGFVFSQVLSSCVSLGVFEQLKDTVARTEALAKGCGLEPGRMQLLLEQAERLQLVKKVERDRWVMDDAGAVVAADPGLQAMIRHHALFYRDLADPTALLQAPAPDTELKKYWAYAHAQDPADIGTDITQPYSELMRNSQEMLADCILAAHDFSQYPAVLDVGGGEGAFLAAIGKACPDTRLHLFDLPSVTDLAQKHLAENRLTNRTEVHGGDFSRDSIPDNADCVTLVRILCDHDDARVEQILANLHRSLKPGTEVMIAEAMAGNSEGAQLAAVYFSLYFLAMGSGRCRSDADIKDLLLAAGFKSAHTKTTPNPLLATLVFAQR